MDKESALELLLWSLGRESYYPEPEEAMIDLEGWLELPWNDAPLLIVTGMNDGKVPDSHPADAFLPDTLRRQLNLRHDEDRLARDAYLMTSLIESRRGQGRVCFVVGKTGASGDVLKPSRLLFQCSDAELPRRAERLFGTPPEARAGHPSSISFRLEAAPPPDVPAENLELKRISVTAFRDYLDCPFRYYLKHVLGMEALDDQKKELDAMGFGSLVHDTLHQMALNEEMRRCEGVDRLQEFLCGKAADWVTERFGQ
jgi:ATP-dependent helicase/nuclease subunit B